MPITTIYQCEFGIESEIETYNDFHIVDSLRLFNIELLSFIARSLKFGLTSSIFFVDFLKKERDYTKNLLCKKK